MAFYLLSWPLASWFNLLVAVFFLPGLVCLCFLCYIMFSLSRFIKLVNFCSQMYVSFSVFQFLYCMCYNYKGVHCKIKDKTSPVNCLLLVSFLLQLLFMSSPERERSNICMTKFSTIHAMEWVLYDNFQIVRILSWRSCIPRLGPTYLKSYPFKINALLVYMVKPNFTPMVNSPTLRLIIWLKIYMHIH